MRPDSTLRESEAKFEVDDGFEFPDMDGVVVDASLSPPTERVVEDTYYDTDDLRLLRWGCTFRHRKRQGWTVKLPVASTARALVRDEINFRGRAGVVPPEAALLVASFTRGRALEPIASLRTARTVHTVTSSDGEQLVELVDDRVSTRTADGTESSFLQVEAEFGPGADAEARNAVIDRLVAAGARLETDGGVKLVKALGEHKPGEPDVVVAPVGDDPTARQLIQWALARSTRQLITELPVALVGEDPRGVHQARVATRRLRSDLRTFAPLLERASQKRLQRDLKPLADILGAIRDTDVLLDRLDAAIDRHPRIDERAGEEVLAVLRNEREAARDDLVGYVEAGTIDELLDSLVAMSETPPTTTDADTPAAERLPNLIRKRWRALDRAVSRLGGDPAPSALHQVRLLAKRTRYAAEAVSAEFGKPARRFASALAEVQELLGEQNDRIVAERWLAAHAGEFDPSAAFAAGVLAETMAVESLTAADGWLIAYERAAKKRNRSWIT